MAFAARARRGRKEGPGDREPQGPASRKSSPDARVVVLSQTGTHSRLPPILATRDESLWNQYDTGVNLSRKGK